MSQHSYSREFYKRKVRKAELLAMWHNVKRNRQYIWGPLILIMILEGLQMVARVQVAELVRLLELKESAKLAMLLIAVILIDFGGLWAEIKMWRLVNRDIYYKMSQEQKYKLIKHVSNLGYLFFANTPASQIQDRINRSQYLPDLIVEGLRILVGNLFQTGLSMIIMLFYSPALSVVAICAFVLIIRADRLMRRQRRVVKEVRRTEEEGAYDSEVRVVNANQTLLDGGVMETTLGTIRLNNRRMQELAGLETEMGLQGVGILRDWGVFLGRRGILALAILSAITGDFSPADFMLVYTLAETTFIGVWSLMHYMDDLQRYSPIAQDIEELLEVQPTVPEHSSHHAALTDPVGIRLDKVTYAYPGSVSFLRPDSNARFPGEAALSRKGSKLRERLGLPPVATDPKVAGDLGYLHQISFCINPGEVVALVGPSGSGKTTIARLLRKVILPDGGDIYFGEHSILDIPSQQIHNFVGIVQQSIDILPETLMENVTLGDKRFTEDDVIAALKAACLWDELVSRWQDTIYQVLGDRGFTLSGGQQQRLAMARVFLRKPQLVILDEATSSQDTVTERSIQESLGQLLEGRSALIIAHRLSTVRKAHKIVVLDKGLVAETGSWDELYTKTDGIFRQLVDAQQLN